jgi:2-polyprenyl-6-methoxyphenol hydroxylase-like FAD-dependent oxidoreductase
MPPFMAQGGALALEDAAVLSALLQDADWSAVAESLTVRRRERVAWVRARSQRREKLARLP